ncbi:EcoAI/FtnUII family type I restriction enzme subunit R [Acholeplasma equifetale]|uniref:EcoAI/FtnUII family type I restriction enzme subunit R n=1 Tax=Acholeplasma equifetale TaxID=264634 RepID=UPI000479C4E8|nr:DEAD/DEAH box helicase family protein [Acholeplasma equifetale]
MKKLTEEDVKFRYIDPAIENIGWRKSQINKEYYFTDGQIKVSGKKVRRAKAKKADYLLKSSHGEIPLAVIEAKDLTQSVGSGMQQAIEYAKILDIPFAYSSNGNGFLEHDFFTGQERELKLDEFPSESELWDRYLKGKGFNREQEDIISEPYYYAPFNTKTPRYYQRIAIQRTIEAIANGQKRILLVMATGTGKTYTAFQIIHRLWKQRKVKRVLYLADRNILIDQTMQQDFKPFEEVMTKIKGKELDSAYEIYMSLYHQLAGDENEEPFREFKKDFFDLILVDEAHRGSAKEDSQWRKILEYFSSAIQIGMTATPKETKYVSNIEYFGEPVYTYSLKQGIDDGFLAPYKVIRVNLDKDLEGWRPYSGQLDMYGQEIEDREYGSKDFDRNIIIDERTKMVAKRITKWLHDNGRFSKTIIFCVDIDHAERMRQALVNENTDLVKDNEKYIMRITGDNDYGKAQLDYFIDPFEIYPTVVTTSKLLSTGVDVKTARLIVLDNNINSMTEFKQIIGRGTRLYPDQDKYYFTIMDFRNVTRLFADESFDGDPVSIFEPKDIDDVEGETSVDDFDLDVEYVEPEEIVGDHKKYRVNNVDVTILSERVQYYDKDGKLITESLVDYTRKNILNEYATMDDFIHMWTEAEKKTAIIEELLERGVFLDALRDESKTDYDDFDLILHIAYDKKPLTKSERVKKVKEKGYLDKYSEVCKDVLSSLLEKYMDGGINDLEDTKILETHPFSEIGRPAKIARLFGGRNNYLQAVQELQQQLYITT